MTNKQKICLVGIILLAIFFRFYQIASLPGGLFPDEAANGLDINLMQQGQLQPFYERGNGREALFFYMLWGSVEAFGKGPWQHHVVSALVGVLSVLACFLFTRRLFLVGSQESGGPDRANWLRATNIALLSAFLMAVSTWHIVLSRTAFRANLIALFAPLVLYFLLAAFQSKTLRKQLLYSFAGGVSLALGFYSYIAYRVLIPILGVAFLWPLLTSFFRKPRLSAIKKYWKAALACAVGFAFFIYPLAEYFYSHPGSFVGRSGQVSVFNPELNQGDLFGTIWTVAKKSVAAYFTQGDLNWRHNISGLPFLSPMISPFFAVGLTLALLLAVWYFFAPDKRTNFWKYFLLTGLFWGMLLPVVTTAEGIPHGLRAIGTIPAVFIISAWIIYEAHGLIVKLHQRIRDRASVLAQTAADEKRRNNLVVTGYKTLVACFIASSVLYAYYWYFGYAANSPENYYAFRSDLTAASDFLKEYGNKNNTYLVLDKFSVQTTDYITMIDGRHPQDPRNNPYTQVDPEDSWKLQGLKPGDQIVFTQSSLFDIKKFKQYHPQSYLWKEYRNKFNQTVLAVYKIR